MTSKTATNQNGHKASRQDQPRECLGHSKNVYDADDEGKVEAT